MLPVMYSLPKIHKAEVPMRPIVSCLNTPAYNLSKLLATLINEHLVYKSKYSIMNSYQFCDVTRDVIVPNGCVLVSFDICNLFSSVPIAETLPLIKTY